MSTPPATPFLFRDDAAFMADLPYDPEVLLFDEMLEIDRDKNLIRCRMHTHDELPLTRSQRAHPRLHPRHIGHAMDIGEFGHGASPWLPAVEGRSRLRL